MTAASDTLRRAAKVLREHAEAATAGPWESDGGGEVAQHWSRPEPWQPIVSTEVKCGQYCYGGSARGVEHDEDADYIALMDPTVGLALAEWLSLVARLLDEGFDANTETRAALRTARAVLREDEPHDAD